MKDSLQKISEETMLTLMIEQLRQHKQGIKSETFKKMIGIAVAEKYGK